MGWRETAAGAGSTWRKTAGVETDGIEPPEPDSLDFMKPERPTGSVLSGIQQGATLGFGDELTGLAGAAEEAGKRARQGIGLQDEDPSDAQPAINPNGPEIKKSWGPSQPAGTKPVIPDDATPRPGPSLADAYRNVRDRDRASNRAAQDAHGGLYLGGELAGGFAVPALGAVAKGGSLVKKALAGAGAAGLTGAAFGAGKSDKEDLAGVATDALETGLISAPFGAAGGAAAHGLGKLGERFGAKAAAAKTAEELRRLDEVRGSALGSMRQAKGEAIRLLERAAADSNNPRLSQAARDRALAFLEGPEGKRLAEEAAEALMDQAPEQMGRMASTKTDFLMAPAKAAQESADYFSKNTITADMLPRALHYGKPALAATIGGVAGGPAGAAAGGLLGTASGAPGRAIANLAKRTPRFTVQANEALQTGANLSGEALEKLAAQLGVRVEDLAGDELRKRFGGD